MNLLPAMAAAETLSFNTYIPQVFVNIKSDKIESMHFTTYMKTKKDTKILSGQSIPVNKK